MYFFQPFIDTNYMKFMMTGEHPHMISFFILHETYVASDNYQQQKIKAKFKDLPV